MEAVLDSMVRYRCYHLFPERLQDGAEHDPVNKSKLNRRPVNVKARQLMQIIPES